MFLKLCVPLNEWTYRNAVKKIFRSRRKRSELKKSLFQVGQVFKDFGSTFLGLQRRVSAGRWAEGLRESSLGVWGRHQYNNPPCPQDVASRWTDGLCGKAQKGLVEKRLACVYSFYSMS